VVPFSEWASQCRVKGISSAVKERTMNNDQIKGTAKDIAGKVQEGVGKAIDSKEQQARGLEKQVEGQAQKTLGGAKEIVRGE
jgi:uncharacterized protein YjbJ (UPF0337 family)